MTVETAVNFVSETAEPLNALLPANAKLLPFAAQSAQAFAEVGVPTFKAEEWKYTPIRKHLERDFTAATSQGNVDADAIRAQFNIPAEDALLVLINGQIQLIEQKLDGVRIESFENSPLTEAEFEGFSGDKETPLVLMNSSYLANGFRISVDAEVTPAARLRIIHLADGAIGNAWFVRQQISVAAKADVTIVEHFAALNGASDYFSNIVSAISVADEAKLRHYRHQADAADAIHYAAAKTTLGHKSDYKTFTLTTGAKMARNEMFTDLTGTFGNCQIDGAYLVKDQQHSDTTSVIQHTVEDCTSHQVYKGAIDDNAKGVFQGRINVFRDAQRTDGYQLNRALLLSKKAEINSKPQLEIFADDVKCSHGATCGEIEDDALFYLRSRGISADDARAIMIASFTCEAIELIEDEQIREDFFAIVHGWLEARKGTAA